jgi:hypothetical protein
VTRSTREVVELARQAVLHADEGTYMSLFVWPAALGHADSAQADDENPAGQNGATKGAETIPRTFPGPA